ncbi:MAG: DUF3568 family protein [Candidatus Omnitrophota bacterium]
MAKKIISFIFCALLLVNMCGCVALLAGAAGGAGTATWLSGKLSQEVNASFEKSLKASRTALKSLKMDIEKDTVKDNVAQLISTYTDGRTTWVDIHRVSQSISKIEVRVGMKGDKEVARKILDKIIKSL